MKDAERDAHAARLRGLLYLACPDASSEGIEDTAKAIAASPDEFPRTAVSPAARLNKGPLLRPLNLDAADLASAVMPGADLTGAILTSANLSRGDLHGAILPGADMTRANLTGADLIGATLVGANLTGANLTSVNLAFADMTRANLTGANLTGANLTSAGLLNADLTGANLTGALLTDMFYVGLVWSDTTDWPRSTEAKKLQKQSVSIGQGRWQVQGAGFSEAELDVPPVPVR